MTGRNFPIYLDINKASNEREDNIISEVERNTDIMLKWGIIEEIAGVGGAVDYVGHVVDNTVITDEMIANFLLDYSNDPTNKVNGTLKTEKDLFLAFWKAMGGKNIEIYMPTVYEEKSVAGVKRMMRLNWLVYLRLKKMLIPVSLNLK